MKVIPSICAVTLWALSANCFADPITYPPLLALNFDIRQTSVSGISSGGFMAVQLAVLLAMALPNACSLPSVRLA